MKSMLIGWLALCFCLPLVGADLASLPRSEYLKKVLKGQYELLERKLNHPLYNPNPEYLALVSNFTKVWYQGTAATYDDIGRLHHENGEYDRAMENHQKSLAMYLELIELLKNYKGAPSRMEDNAASANRLLQRVALCYSLIGLVHLAKGEYYHALENHQKALAIKLKQFGPDHPELARDYNNIGDGHLFRGEYDKALEYFQKSLALRLKKLDEGLFLKPRPRGKLKTDPREVSRNPTTFSFAARRAIHGKVTTDLEVAQSYNAIGAVHSSMGKYGHALECFQKSLTLGPRYPNAAQSYNNIGSVYYKKDGYDKALEYFQKSLAIRLNELGPDHPDVAQSHNNIGNVYADRGDYVRALEYFQKALATRLKKLSPDNPSVALSYNSTGRAHHGLKNPTAALAAARKAQAINDKHLTYMLSFTAERERLVYQKQQKPFDLFGTLNSAPDLVKAILHNKGIVLSSLMEDQLAAEASSDPKIKELVSNLRVASRQLNKLEMENPKDTSEAGWKVHRTGLEAARAKAEALQKQLALNVGGYGNVRAWTLLASLSLTVKVVQSRLPKDAVLLEYITYKQDLGKGKPGEHYGAVILPETGEPKWVPLGSVEPINQLLSKYSPLKPTDDEEYEEVLRGLHDKLMAPVVKQLPMGTKTLVLCPDGLLNFLSFATLLTEEDTFLCEEYTLKYVSSGRDLVPGKKINQPKGNLMVFANPAYTEEPIQLAGTNGADTTLRSVDRDELRSGLQFKALPGTQKEADYLKNKTTDWKLKPEIYVGKEATEAAISGVKSPRILHLATHGFFLPDPEGVKKKQTPVGMQLGGEQKYRGRLSNPMHRSGLAFAGAQKTLDAWAKGETPPTHNDGILTAAEASVLDLKGTWLVTLSACETGRGEARSGEGVLGLRRAFIQAGAQNLLMTLWPVDDKQTIPFMKEFYERAMADGDAPKSLAKVQTERLVKLRDVLGTRLAVQFAGPFIMSFQGAE